MSSKLSWSNCFVEGVNVRNSTNVWYPRTFPMCHYNLTTPVHFSHQDSFNTIIVDNGTRDSTICLSPVSLPIFKNMADASDLIYYVNGTGTITAPGVQPVHNVCRRYLPGSEYIFNQDTLKLVNYMTFGDFSFSVGGVHADGYISFAVNYNRCLSIVNSYLDNGLACIMDANFSWTIYLNNLGGIPSGGSSTFTNVSVYNGYVGSIDYTRVEILASGDAHGGSGCGHASGYGNITLGLIWYTSYNKYYYNLCGYSYSSFTEDYPSLLNRIVLTNTNKQSYYWSDNGTNVKFTGSEFQNLSTKYYSMYGINMAGARY